MLGAGTRTKIKGGMNTQRNKPQFKPLRSFLSKVRSKDRKKDDSEIALGSSRTQRQAGEAVG